MASLVCSGLILLATFFLLPWLYFLPKCVLAVMYVDLFYPVKTDTQIDIRIALVVFSLIAEMPHDILYYWKSVSFSYHTLSPFAKRYWFRMEAWVDLAIMSLTFFLSIVYNIEVGVVASLVFSLLLVVHRSSKTRMTILVGDDPRSRDSIQILVILGTDARHRQMETFKGEPRSRRKCHWCLNS